METIESVLSRLKESAADVSRIESAYPLTTPRLESGCTAAELADLQAFVSRQLPDDYQAFLLACRSISAADVFNGYFFFSPLRLAAIYRDSSIPLILHIPDHAGIPIEAHVVAFAGDGGGNLFVLELGAAKGRVWKWLHEYPVRVDRVANEGLTLVAPSFSEFLSRVADDWQHFVKDDRSWSYLSG